MDPFEKQEYDPDTKPKFAYPAMALQEPMVFAPEQNAGLFAMPINQSVPMSGLNYNHNSEIIQEHRQEREEEKKEAPLMFEAPAPMFEYKSSDDKPKMMMGKKGMEFEAAAPVVFGAEHNGEAFVQHRMSMRRKATIQNESGEQNSGLLDNEGLIANEDEISDYKTLIQCMICQELALLSKEPQYCGSC